MVPTWSYIQGVLKVKVKVKGHVIRTLFWFDENLSSFHEWASAIVRRPSSVCPSVNFYTQVATSTTHMTRSPPNLHTMVHTWSYIQDVLKVKVKVKGHVIWTLFWFDENRYFYLKHDSITTKLAHDGPHVGVIKVKVKGHVMWTLFWFDENRYFYHKHDWIATKLAHDCPH